MCLFIRCLGVFGKEVCDGGSLNEGDEKNVRVSGIDAFIDQSQIYWMCWETLDYLVEAHLLTLGKELLLTRGTFSLYITPTLEVDIMLLTASFFGQIRSKYGCFRSFLCKECIKALTQMLRLLRIESFSWYYKWFWSNQSMKWQTSRAKHTSNLNVYFMKFLWFPFS